jgi:hypothetical protein
MTGQVQVLTTVKVIDRMPQITIEEAGETITAIAKVLRFGRDQEYMGSSNGHKLAVEIGQLKYCLDALVRQWDLNPETINSAYLMKPQRIEYYERNHTNLWDGN